MIPGTAPDPEQLWLQQLRQASAWFGTPPGQQLLDEEVRLLRPALERCFGRYLLHYSPGLGWPLQLPQIGSCIRLGPPLPGLDLYCQEQAWPVAGQVADVVVLQHALDFSRDPHALLREAARCVRPGGHLLVTGFNPWSLWGLRGWLGRGAPGQQLRLGAGRLGEWLKVLGFALEQRQYGCYCPPRAGRPGGLLQRFGQSRQLPVGGVYLLAARRLMSGLRPLTPERRLRQPVLIPLPVVRSAREMPARAEPVVNPAEK